MKFILTCKILYPLRQSISIELSNRRRSIQKVKIMNVTIKFFVEKGSGVLVVDVDGKTFGIFRKVYGCNYNGYKIFPDWSSNVLYERNIIDQIGVDVLDSYFK